VVSGSGPGRAISGSSQKTPENSIRSGCQLWQKGRQLLRMMQRTLPSVPGCVLELLFLHQETLRGDETARRAGLP
jgi:hypothetical protein